MSMQQTILFIYLVRTALDFIKGQKTGTGLLVQGKEASSITRSLTMKGVTSIQVQSPLEWGAKRARLGSRNFSDHRQEKLSIFKDRSQRRDIQRSIPQSCNGLKWTTLKNKLWNPLCTANSSPSLIANASIFFLLVHVKRIINYFSSHCTLKLKNTSLNYLNLTYKLDSMSFGTILSSKSKVRLEFCFKKQICIVIKENTLCGPKIVGMAQTNRCEIEHKERFSVEKFWLCRFLTKSSILRGDV